MVVEHKIGIDEFETWIARPEHQERYFELIDGEIIEKTMPTQQHGLLSAKLIIRVGVHTEQNKLGRVASEVRHVFGPGEIRQPDVVFYASLTAPVIQRGPVEAVPDLVIEIKSPDESIAGLREKARFYIEKGCKLVWLIYPDKRLVEVYSADEIDILTESDTLDGGAVLPGFQLTLKELFAF